MTDTDLSTAPRRRGGLTGMVLADLRALASDMGLSGTTGMRKGDLIVAIKERQGGAGASHAVTSAGQGHATRVPVADPAAGAEVPAARPPRQRRVAARPTGAPETGAPETGAPETGAPETGATETGATEASAAGASAAGAGAPAPTGDTPSVTAQPASATSEPSSPDATGQGPAERNSQGPVEAQNGREQDGRGERQGGRSGRQTRAERQANQSNGQSDRDQGADRDQNRSEQGGTQNAATQNAATQNAATQHSGGQHSQGSQNGSAPQAGRNDRNNSNNDDDEAGRGRRGGRRFRERRRGRDRGGDGGQGGQVQGRDDREIEVREDDVLQPVAGILDVLDNYAFVRTSGYLAGSNDVYVAMNMVRKNGLRRGDAITGAVRIPRDGEQSGSRQKFNPLVRIDTINGGDAEAARQRPEFTKLTPLYPNQRLRLETTPNVLTTRIIDLVMPIGKGQRALIVSPPKAGKTSVLQAIANAIAVNNPECHLMVVLVDERPEEVTDMQRSVKGEVISSTFDRPPGDHTAVAELAIERAKRLVESGRDVVVLLDSITRLGRAYNNSSPASGRILSGGVDSTALYPPKRFLGAARNIEHGGSLTIIATAMVETGSTGDTVIFEEFKGTGNAELKLDRKIAERRVFPAVDVNPSGTRKDELLMNSDEYQVALKLRRVLTGLDSHQAIDLLLDRLRKSGSNAEFMMQVARTAPAGMAASDES